MESIHHFVRARKNYRAKSGRGAGGQGDKQNQGVKRPAGLFAGFPR